MEMCYKCHNRNNFTIIDNCAICNECNKIIYEKKINKCKHKITHLKNILRKFSFEQTYILDKLYNEIDKKDLSPKTVKLFLKKENINDWIFYHQFLNKLYNIPFSLSFEDKEKIMFIFYKYIRFMNKRFSYKNFLICIFDQLDINFCIKPEKDEVFNGFLEYLSNKTDF